MTTEKIYAFWPYDLFPYVLGSQAQPVLRVKNGIAYAFSDAYNGEVQVHHQETLDSGIEVNRELMELRIKYDKELESLGRKYKQLALDIAPFLTHFPAYEVKK